MGRLQTSHLGASEGDGGAEWDVSGVGCGCLSFGRTMERYLFAMLVPVSGVGSVEYLEKDVVVLSSCSEDRIKGTRLRRMPAPKIRWSSRGTK